MMIQTNKLKTNRLSVWQTSPESLSALLTEHDGWTIEADEVSLFRYYGTLGLDFLRKAAREIV